MKRKRNAKMPHMNITVKYKEIISRTTFINSIIATKKKSSVSTSGRIQKVKIGSFTQLPMNI